MTVCIFILHLCVHLHLTKKHHDGFALFDTGNTTHRSSVHLGPRRDFLQELMETAKKEKPNLHRGTYYSLPEWLETIFNCSLTYSDVMLLQGSIQTRSNMGSVPGRVV